MHANVTVHVEIHEYTRAFSNNRRLSQSKSAFIHTFFIFRLPAARGQQSKIIPTKISIHTHTPPDGICEQLSSIA